MAIAAAALLAASGVLLVRSAFQHVRGDTFAKILSGRAVAGFALCALAVGALGLPYLIAQQSRRCVREETVNVLVGRVSQAQKVCVDYSDGSTDSVRASALGIRFSPPSPTRDAPFTIVVFGLEPSEQVEIGVAPPGVGLEAAPVVADRAGEARIDFRIPAGGQRDWLVSVRRASGQTIEANVPLPPP